MIDQSFEQFAKRVMSGEARGFGAATLRCALAIAEPFYAMAMRLRNWSYSRGLIATHRLSVPVISVGNITTGGTGKTPLVIWLARELAARGRRPAIILRGYKSRGGVSDEQRVLESALAGVATVVANPDRVSAGKTLLESGTSVDVILLDDGFQHRRLSRDFDLVLIDATAPFGFGHALPRGLLREPLSGLERADAFVRTRVDQADPATLSAIDSELRSRNRDAPIYQSRHVMRSLLAANGDSIAPEQLRGRRMLAFCGIGNPQSFNAQLTDLGAVVVGLEAFADHHDYSEPDMTGLNERARSAGAEFLVTTEKDWAKVEKLAGWISLPLWRVGLDIEIEDGGLPLLRQIEQKLASAIATTAVASPSGEAEETRV